MGLLKSVLRFTLASSLLSMGLCPRLEAADTITFTVVPFGQFDVSVQSLATFAETGTITPDLQFYTEHLQPAELEKLRKLLGHSFAIDSVGTFSFLNSAFGKELVQQLSYLIAAPAQESQPFLSGAIITASENPNGFTVVDVLKAYDHPQIVLDLGTFQNTINQADQLYQVTDRIFTWLTKQDVGETVPSSAIQPATLAQAGGNKWTTENLTIPRPQSSEVLEVFLYLPEGNSAPAPLVIIAPGLNSDFQSFTYIAEHLASYGFAIAGVNFPESDNARMADALQGLDTFPSPNAWLEQPQDITLILDNLSAGISNNPQWQGKFDVNNVGILGHSLGGYTAMASGGANLIWEDLLQQCQQLNQPGQINLNPALLWQCQGAEQNGPNGSLQDERIKAVLAINPVTNPIFGPEGVKDLTVPTLIIAGSNDIFAPPLPEQITPFSLLPGDEKYLLLVQNGTHLSFLGNTDNLPERIVGPGQTVAYGYLKSLGLAFFNLYLRQDKSFAPYLTDGAVQRISQAPLPLHLVRSLTSEQLQQAMEITD